MINTIKLIEEDSYKEMNTYNINTITQDLKNLWNILDIREEE